jgi:hypothetical protein
MPISTSIFLPQNDWNRNDYLNKKFFTLMSNNQEL